MSFQVCKLSITEIKELLFSSHHKSRLEIIALLKQDKRVGVQRLVASFEADLKKSNQLEQEFLRLSSFEEKLRKKGFSAIAGVDEVGRGAFAGPIVAAAVILPHDFFLPGIKECKQLLPEAREKLYKKIIENACDWHVETLEPSYIDEEGLHKANLIVLERAVLNLSKTPDYVLSDGFSLANLKLPNIALIGGDKLSVSIAAASIIAKVERDRIMVSYSKKFPDYGFDHNKGYGTKEHLEALEQLGLSPIHRLCFKPVRKCVELRLGDF